MPKPARLGVLCAAAAALPLAALAFQDPSFTPPPNIPRQSAWIAVRHQRQELNLCAPTSASMILDYFGVSIAPRKIKALSRGNRYKDHEEFLDFTGTSNEELLLALRRLGYRWRAKGYPQTAVGFEHGVADIERSLDAGIPVLIDTVLGAEHAYVVAGYSAPKKSLYIVDPDSEAPGIRAVRLTDLIWIWKDGHDPRDVRSAVFPSHLRRTFSRARQ